MTKTSQEVTIIDFTKFDVTQLPELKGKKAEIQKIIKANPIVEITDNASYELAKKSRTAVKTLRTGLEREQKDVKNKIKEYVLEVVDKEYDSLIGEVRSSENERQNSVSAWEEIKENERLEKLRLEQERVDGIKKSISDFFSNWSERIGSLQFANLEDFDAEFGEVLINYDKFVFAEFEVLFTDAVSNLTYMLSEKKSNLVAQENIRIEQERLKIQNEIATWFRIWSDRIITSASAEKCEQYFKEFNTEVGLNCGDYQSEYSDKRKELLASFGKRIEMLKNYEKQQAEQKQLAEKNRIAQEKLDKEKADFQAEQLKVRTQNRIKELLDAGCVFLEDKNCYQKGGYHLHLSDIEMADDDMWLRELGDCRAVVICESEKIDDSVIQEVEFEEVADDLKTFDPEEILLVEEKHLKGITVIDNNWQTIFDEFANDTDTIYLDKSSITDFINWCEERYNCPNLKF